MTDTIERSDIEQKLRQIRGEVERGTEAARPIGLAVAGVATLALVTLAYLAGRRRGRKGRTVVEVRRV